METEKKNIVSTSEIEEKVEAKMEENFEEEGPNFAPLSAQDLAVFLIIES